jgi:hypothetical protein
MTTRHELLQQLHELLQPKVYLEIGVQHGWSLQLSKAPISIGVDPNPIVSVPLGDHHAVVKMTSDDYFAEDWGSAGPSGSSQPIDLAFIDGMHLAEFAWRDFLNVAKYCHAGSVVVFDDVLPYTSEMAAREICPGDWTGDVWKVFYELRRETDYVLQLVDTSPTGTLVVTGFDIHHEGLHQDLGQIGVNAPVFAEVLDRRHAWSAPVVIENLKDRGFGK